MILLNLFGPSVDILGMMREKQNPADRELTMQPTMMKIFIIGLGGGGRMKADKCDVKNKVTYRQRKKVKIEFYE